MNRALWGKIEQFDFDYPVAVYGFSTRLAYKNKWTIAFTQGAILEYKKFMYLAATSDFMVSPSEIVDIVWHEHLIFTQSYQDFCTILDKKIAHIPSTHDKNEKEKFVKAKEKTTNLYESVFGKQPPIYWEYNLFIDTFQFQKIKTSTTEFMVYGTVSFIILLIPACYALMPLYKQINNPYFLIGYLILSAICFILLEVVNRNYLHTLLNDLIKNPILKQLKPTELIFMKTRKLENVVHGFVNQLVEEGVITILTNNTIIKNKEKENVTPFDKAILENLENEIFYTDLLPKIMGTAVFSQIKLSISEVQQYFTSSLQYMKLFILNFCTLFLLLLLGFSRLAIGIFREKPVVFICFIMIGLLIFSLVFLNRTKHLLFSHFIPNLYKNQLIPFAKQDYRTWDWNYFLLGTAILSNSFIPLITFTQRNDGGLSGGNTYDSTGGSSCSSGGGSGGDSSCGGGCGGCGSD